MDWISVKDRLPEQFEPVMVYAKSTSVQGGAITFVGACKNGFWFIQNSEAALGYPNLQYEVTHWMPLPQQPKEG